MSSTTLYNIVLRKKTYKTLFHKHFNKNNNFFLLLDEEFSQKLHFLIKKKSPLEFETTFAYLRNFFCTYRICIWHRIFFFIYAYVSFIEFSHLAMRSFSKYVYAWLCVHMPICIFFLLNIDAFYVLLSILPEIRVTRYGCSFALRVKITYAEGSGQFLAE